MKHAAVLFQFLAILAISFSVQANWYAVIARKKAGGGGTDPGTANLIAWYQLSDATDSDVPTAYNLSTGAGTPTYSAAAPTAFDEYFLVDGGEALYYVDAGAGTPFDPSGSFSVSLYVYATDATPATATVPFGKWEVSGNNRQYRLDLNTGGTMTFYVSSNGTGNTSVTSSATLSDTTWHHVVVVFEASTAMRIYIDGVKAENTTSIPASAFDGGGDFTLGAYDSSFTQDWVGRLDNVRFYDDALTDDEVTYLGINE